MTSSLRRRHGAISASHPQAHRKEAAAKAVKTKRERGTIKKAERQSRRDAQALTKNEAARRQSARHDPIFRFSR